MGCTFLWRICALATIPCDNIISMQKSQQNLQRGVFTKSFMLLGMLAWEQYVPLMDSSLTLLQNIKKTKHSTLSSLLPLIFCSVWSSFSLFLCLLSAVQFAFDQSLSHFLFSYIHNQCSKVLSLHYRSRTLEPVWIRLALLGLPSSWENGTITGWDSQYTVYLANNAKIHWVHVDS